MTLSTTRLRTLAFALAIVAMLAFGTTAARAQDTSAAPATHSWTTDQIVIATVHQAWLLADKDEANFFEIIKELTEISAKNRNLTLPDSPEAGKKAGAYIKKEARSDHDQLLYAIVDKSVRMTGTKAATPAQ
jgi:Tfp pilus assembly protein FimT